MAIDLVGGETFFKTFDCVRFYGTVVTLLSPDPKHADWVNARLRNLRISFELMLTPMYYDLGNTQDHHRHILEDGARLIDDGKLSIVVSNTFPLEAAAEAHRMIQEGHATGKIVLKV